MEAFLVAGQNTSGPTTGNFQWSIQNPSNSMMHTFPTNHKINWDAQASSQIAPGPITENSQKSSKSIPGSMMIIFQGAKIYWNAQADEYVLQRYLAKKSRAEILQELKSIGYYVTEEIINDSMVRQNLVK